MCFDPLTGPDGSTTSVDTCGNGELDDGDECDGEAFGEVSCESLGFDTGELVCSDSCTIDDSGCQSITVVQNDDGNCVSALACAPKGGPGNPQEAVECFDRPAEASAVAGVEYLLAEGPPNSPTGATAVIYEWNGVGSMPGAVVGEFELPAEQVATDFGVVVFDEPVSVEGGAFCVGIRGSDPTETIRLRGANTFGLESASFVHAPVCIGPELTPVVDIGGAGNWYVRAMVLSAD